MIHLSKAIPGCQDVFTELRKCIRKNEPPKKEDLQRWYNLLKDVNKANHERLFVVMTAQDKGWLWAKDLDFYQGGM
jgi:hypothetical protein